MLVSYSQSLLHAPQFNFSLGVPNVNATYDYVVVGGGTAGATLATRLAESPHISVALIEAGGFYEVDNGNRSTVPGYAGVGVGTAISDVPSPLIDWGFVTVPQAVSNHSPRFAGKIVVPDWTDKPLR